MTKRTRIRQRDITDCGAACIASIAAHYRLHLPVSRIRQYAGTDQRGTNVLGLLEAAERLGLQAKAAKGGPDALTKIPLPAILHLALKNGLHHYVVLYKASTRHVTYMDPADGALHRETMSRFTEKWTGVVVLMAPGNDFVQGNRKQSHAQRFWQLIQPHKGLVLQALLAALLYTILGISTSIYVQKIVDFVLVEGNTRLLNLLSVVMIILLVFQVLLGTFKTIFGLQTGQHIDARLILGYYQHILQLPQRFFDTMRVGEIISRVNDAVKIRLFINDVALNLFVNALIILVSLAVMFLYYWKLALLMLGILPLYALFYFISNRINRRWNRTLMEQSADLESQLVESLNAAGTIKRFGLEHWANDKTEDRFRTLLRSIYRSGIQSLLVGSSTEFITRLFTILILWAGSYFVIQRELSAGELLSFYSLIGYFTGPAAALIGANRSIQDALIAADRLFEIIDMETECGQLQTVPLMPEQLGDIVFDNVHFRYGTRAMVFEGLSLRLEKGKTTAVVGESGSGKSTLLNLLQNLYPVKEGKISIGPFNIQYISHKSLRALVAVVPQHIDLFAGTVIENIAPGDAEPDLAYIIFLCRLLGIDHFIEQLPQSYHSLLHEQGSNLSGGQRQRLAIARALYKKPEILVLDEATSSLDPAAEHKVQEALAWFRQQGKTLIVITHRLSTVQQADTIHVLQAGKLAESGTHEQLLARDGVYAALWKQ